MATHAERVMFRGGRDLLAVSDRKGLAIALDLVGSPKPASLSTAAFATVAASSAANAFSRVSTCELAVSRSSKVYQIELKSIFWGFTPKQLLITALRSVILHCSPVMEDWWKEFEEAEKRAEAAGTDIDIPPMPDFGEVWQKAVKSMVRGTAVTTVRKTLEHLAVYYLDAQIAWKMIKDLPKSARRKAVRDSSAASSLVRAANMSRTVMKGYALTVAGEVVVQQAILAQQALRDLRDPNPRIQARALKRWYRQTVLNVAKGGGMLVTVAAASGAVVLLQPKNSPAIAYYSTIVATVIGDIAGDLMVGAFLDDWARDVEGLVEP